MAGKKAEKSGSAEPAFPSGARGRRRIQYSVSSIQYPVSYNRHTDILPSDFIDFLQWLSTHFQLMSQKQNFLRTYLLHRI